MKKFLIVLTAVILSLAGQTQDYIHGSIQKNAVATKVDIVFQPTFNSSAGESVNSILLAVAIPSGVSGGITATAAATPGSIFASMGVGTLAAIPAYTYNGERIFGFSFTATSAPASPLPWTAGASFAGVTITFSSSTATGVVKLIDFSNDNGGPNNSTYFAVTTSDVAHGFFGDVTDYTSLFFPIAGESALGLYPATADQYVVTTACSGAVGGTASGSASICGSGTTGLSASGYSTGSGSTYQWVSSTSSTDPTLATNVPGASTNPLSLVTPVSQTTNYWLKVTCTSGLATAYSSMVTVTVNPNVTPTLSISASPSGAICAGTSVTFTATASNLAGGSASNYDFKVNGGSVQSGASNTYSSAALANGDLVTCVVTVSGGTCLTSTTATSNTITMTVNPTSTPTVSIAASPSGAICAGTSVTFTATASGLAGGSVSNYNFKVGGTSVQSGASNTYSSAALANGNQVTCDITVSGGTCLTSSSATSNTITMTVNPTSTPTVSISASPSGSICAGTSVTFTASAPPASLGGGTVSNYDFKVNGSSVQSGASNSYASAALANGNTVTCVITVTGGTCLTSATATSNTITMTVIANVTPTVSISASPSGPICAGTNVTFTASASNLGGGTATYDFSVNGSSVQNSASNTYANAALANGDQVTCDISVTGGTCLTATTASSNTITMTVNANVTPTLSISASPSGSICAGTSVTFTATASNLGGGSASNYNFKVNGGSVQSGASNTYTSTALANGDQVTCVITVSGGTCLTSATATSNTITMTVIANVTPTASISASPSGSVCAGTSVTFTASAPPASLGGGTVSNYDFKVNGSSVQSGASNTYASAALANGNTVTCVITVTGGTCLTSATATSNTITMTVIANVTPTVSISASPSGPVCVGTNVTFTATASNLGGGTATYDFSVNGTSMQSGASNTYANAALATGDLVTCDISVTGGTCLTTTTASSNAITMTVNTNVTPTVSITPSPSGPICAGTSVTFTANPASLGGGTPSYNFKKNGLSVQNGASATYTTTTLANGDQVSCVMTVTGVSCLTSPTATSNTITMTVNANVTPTVSIGASPSGPICAGTSVTFTATASNLGGGTASYDFKVNGSSVQNSASNTYASAALANGNTVTCVVTVTGGTCLTSATATSNTITMTVNALSTPTVSISASPSGPICAGASVTFTASASGMAGGTASYNFKKNGTSVQSGALATYTTTTLANGDQITCDLTVTGGTCLTSSTATSNMITMTVNANLTPTVSISASPGNSICAGSSVTFTATALNTGGGTIAYNFKVGTTSVQNSASNTYTTSALTNGQVVSCVVTVTGGTCLLSTTATSNSITMTVIANVTPTVSIAASPSGAICAGTSVTFTATAANLSGGSVSNYDFKVNGTSVQSGASNTYATTSLTNGNTVNCVITVSGGTCLTTTSATSNTITMVVNATSTPTVSISASPSGPICAGTSVTFTASASGMAGGTASYNFKKNGTSVQSGALATYTTTTLANGDQITCVITVTGGTCLTSATATSNTITMTVNTNLTPTVSIAASPGNSICAGSSVTFTATALNTGGGTIAYNFKVGTTSVQNSASNTYTTSALTNGQVVSCVVTVTGGTCLLSTTATSNSITMTVIANVTPTVSIAASPSGAICAGTSVTFTATAANLSGGSVSNYDFKVNGTSVQSGASNTYATTSLANGNTVNCVITISGGTCLTSPTATSNTITMVVNATSTPTVSIAASPSGPICAGTSVTFTASASGMAGGTASYNFRKNGTSVQSGALATYTTTALANGDQITCDLTVTGGTCLTSATATSNTITMNVIANVTPTVSISASPSGAICAGTSVTFTATASNLGGGTASYNFKVNGSSVQNSASNTYNTNTLANGNTVSCVVTVTGGTCLTTATATSNTITMTVNANVTPTLSISASTGSTICDGTSVTFTATATGLAGGTASYDFKVNGSSVQSSASNTYVTTSLANADQVSCVVTITGGTCLTSPTATSNTITMTVNGPYDITSSVSGGFGTISPLGITSVPCGGRQTYTISPDNCNHIVDVLVDGVSDPAAILSGSYTFNNVSATHTIEVSFASSGPFNLVATSSGNGTITPSGTTIVSCDGGQAYTMTADPGYHIFTVLIDGVNNPTAVTSGTYTFSNVQSDHTIAVTFVSDCTPTTVTIVAMNDIGCGNIQLNAVPTNPGVYTYEWKRGLVVVSTAQTLTLTTASADGLYTVTATGGSCTSPPASYSYTKQTSLQSYTILALDKVDLGETNKVLRGSVGNTKNGGEVRLRKNSTVASTGAFVKASKITVDNPSNVPVRILAPAVVTLPAMLYNTASYAGLKNIAISSNTTVNGNFDDVTIKKGKVVTLTGTIFHNISIEDGAQVTFSSSDINVNELKVGTNSGGAGTPTRVKFSSISSNCSVRVKNKVTVDENCQINPTGSNVMFYLEDGDFDVHGKDTYVTASIYSPDHDIDVIGDASASNTCYMTGRFIAKHIGVGADSKNITWDLFDCAAPPPPPTNPIDPIVSAEQSDNDAVKIAVLAYPNPSENWFNLKLKSGGSDEVMIRVIDMSGRVLQVVKGDAIQTFKVGEKLLPGIYFAEVSQGTNKSVVKLVKQQ